jgi:uncharacterized membrane protein YccF (DUF307 family)
VIPYAWPVQEEHPVSLLSLTLNIIWVLTGGLWMAAGWLLAAVVMAVTIVGLPWSRAAWNIAVYTFLPFGRTALSREEVGRGEDLGTSPLGVVGNLIWLLLAGWWLALGHIITGIALAVTIIGIPFAWAHLKLALLSLWPIGKTIVNVEDVGIRRG